MKTPIEKYLNDSHYKKLVDLLESYIHQAEFTPSEVREAAMFACINYELRRASPEKIMIANDKVDNALATVHEFLHKEKK